MDIVEALRYRAEEIENFYKDADALPSSGNDTYSAKLMRMAADVIENEGSPYAIDREVK